MNSMRHWLGAGAALALFLILSLPAQAQFKSTFGASCVPVRGGGYCNPCGVGIGYRGCYTGYPVGCYPSFYYGGFYAGNTLYSGGFYAGNGGFSGINGLYPGGFYAGTYIPGTGAQPQVVFVPSVFLTANVASSPYCQFTVRVPENARLYFDGFQLADTGSTRRFHTPPLNPGKFNYTVAAEWNENGQTVRMEQKVHFHPGDRLTVDFSKPVNQSVATAQ